MVVSKTLYDFSSSSHQQMFTIQGLLHFFKDRVSGPNLDYPSYLYEDLFKQPFVRDNNFDCLNFKFSGLLK